MAKIADRISAEVAVIHASAQAQIQKIPPRAAAEFQAAITATSKEAAWDVGIVIQDRVGDPASVVLCGWALLPLGPDVRPEGHP